jgi:hypothetical protein
VQSASGQHDRLERVREALRLHEDGRRHEAIGVMERHARERRDVGDRDALMQALGVLGQWELEETENARALERYVEMEQLARELGRTRALASALGGQAQVHYMRRETERALAMSKEEERLYEELGDSDGARHSRERQAELSGDHGAVLRKFAAEQARYRETGNLEGLARSLANQGWYLTRNNRAREGLPCVEQACEIARDLPHLEQNMHEMLAWVRSRL